MSFLLLKQFITLRLKVRLYNLIISNKLILVFKILYLLKSLINQVWLNWVIVLFFHGGGWSSGSSKDHGEFLYNISQYGCVYSYNYNLDGVYSKALKDCLSIYKKLRQQFRRLTIICLTAGATMVIQIILICLTSGYRFPDAAISISPLSDNSLPDNPNKRDWTNNTSHKALLKRYSGNYKYKNSDPLFNPILGDYSNTCPLYLITGSREILYLDNLKLYQHIKNTKNTNVQLIVFQGMFHCFGLFP